MKILRYLIFFCLSASADINLEKECFENKKADACNAVGAQYRFQEKYEKAFEATKVSCELLDEVGCSQMQSDSLRLSVEIQNQVLDTLKKRCEQKPKLCSSLATIYEEKKDYKNAIVFAKKAFLEKGMDYYPVLEHKYGDKLEAYKASAERCHADASTCDFYIRYLPGNPQINSMVNASKDFCLNKEKETSGATTCSILGAYFESRRRYSDSVEMWSKGCERVDKTSCTLLIASKKADVKDKTKAFRTICERQAVAVSKMDSQIQEKYCKKQKNFKTIPSGLLKISQDLLKLYLDEQK